LIVAVAVPVTAQVVAAEIAVQLASLGPGQVLASVWLLIETGRTAAPIPESISRLTNPAMRFFDRDLVFELALVTCPPRPAKTLLLGFGLAAGCRVFCAFGQAASTGFKDDAPARRAGRPRVGALPRRGPVTDPRSRSI
jgi:hypothetical protein